LVLDYVTLVVCQSRILKNSHFQKCFNSELTHGELFCAVYSCALYFTLP
jgi:hypothetical protein